MGTVPRHLLLALAVLLAAGLLPVTAAAAGTASLTDRAGDDGAATDLLGLTVAHAEPAAPRRLVLKIAHGGIDGFEGYFTFWIDTDVTDPGPEYVSDVHPNSGGIALQRVGRWIHRNDRKVRCQGLRARADAFTSGPVVLSVPRACLDTPRRVRGAAVSSAPGAGRSTDRDWVAGRRTWSKWAHR